MQVLLLLHKIFASTKIGVLAITKKSILDGAFTYLQFIGVSLDSLPFYVPVPPGRGGVTIETGSADHMEVALQPLGSS